MKKGDTLIFKFVGGMEVLGKLVKETDDGFIVDKPVNPVPEQVTNEGIQLQLYPLVMVMGDVNQAELYKSNMICAPMVVSEAVDRYYLEQTTTIKLV